MKNDISDLIKEIKKIKRGKTIWSSKTVKAETRKLRSEWTTEMANDISQYSGIDSSIEEELINTLLKELGNDSNILEIKKRIGKYSWQRRKKRDLLKV